jgi:transcription elongation factor GreB
MAGSIARRRINGVSKAFTKEEEGEGLDDLPPVEAWPSGVKNYLTPAGHAALKREIEALREAPRGDGRRKVQLDQRLAGLLQRLEAAEVIDPTAQPRDVAAALTGRRVGDSTLLRTPAGDEELTVTAIDYES